MLEIALKDEVLTRRYSGNELYLIGVAKHRGYPEERFRLTVTEVKTLDDIQAGIADFQSGLVLLTMNVNSKFHNEVLDAVVKTIDDASESGGWMRPPYTSKEELQNAILLQMDIMGTQLRQ